MTAVQVVLIVAVFLSWYYPAYRLAAPAILARRSPFAAEAVLVQVDEILDVDVRNGLLGRWLGYGTVVLQAKTASGGVRLKNLHDPLVVAEQVRRLLREMPAPPALAGQPVAALVAGGENQFVEFKASLMWDYRKQSVNKELYEPVMKNLVGFMNAQGGALLIGVGDDGEILGIEQDMGTLKKPGVDAFENVFNVAFANMIGMEYRQFVDAGVSHNWPRRRCATSPCSRRRIQPTCATRGKRSSTSAPAMAPRRSRSARRRNTWTPGLPGRGEVALNLPGSSAASRKVVFTVTAPPKNHRLPPRLASRTRLVVVLVIDEGVPHPG